MMGIFTIIDWTTMIAAFVFCFYALGNSIGIGKIIIAFTAGITAGVISNIPGGLGVQEGSAAGVLALFGVGLEISVLATLLFRIVLSHPLLYKSGIFWQNPCKRKQAPGCLLNDN